MLKLRLLTGPRAGRQLRVTDTKPVSVGRRVGRLRLHDTRVSKNHAKIFFADGAWVLRDLGSANGTYVNRQRCNGLVELEAGDLVQMGRVLIKILQADAVGMDPSRTLPSLSDTVGIDAFTASGATGELPAIDTGDPVKPSGRSSSEMDLAELFSEDHDDNDLIDFSEQSRMDASPAGTVGGGETQLSEQTIELEPVEADPADAPSAKSKGRHDGEDSDPLLAGVEPEPEETEDLVDIEDATPQLPGTTLLAAIQDGPDEDALAAAAVEDQAEDDVDDEAPAVVGLRLDQSAPQLPEPAAEPEQKVEAEADLEANAEDETDAVVDVELDAKPAETDVDEIEELEEAAEQAPAIEAGADAGIDLALDDEVEAPEAEVSVEPGAELEIEPEEVEAEFEAQPQAATEAKALTEAEAESEAEAEPDEPVAAEAVVDEPEIELEPVTESPAAQDNNETAPPVVDAETLRRAADASLTDIDDQPGTGEAELDLETAHAELAFDDVLDPGPVPVDPELLAQELWPPLEAESDVEVEAQAEHPLELEPVVKQPVEPVAEQTPEETKTVDEVDEAEAGLAEAEPIVPEAEAIEAEAPDAEPEPEVKLEAAEEQPADSFDIDAAFDALSEGLDDSVQMPAITDSAKGDAEASAKSQEQDAAVEDLQASEEAQAEQADKQPEPDTSGLVGSQLDIGFIREALANLESEESEQAPEKPIGSSAVAEADAVAADTVTERDSVVPGEAAAVTQEVIADNRPDSEDDVAVGVSDASPPIVVPPGLNPTSVLPPAEPNRSHRSRSKKSGRWFMTALLLFAVVGLGGALAYTRYMQSIAGRNTETDTGNDNKPGATDANTPQPQPQDNDPAVPTPKPEDTIDPTPPDPGSTARSPWQAAPPVLQQDQSLAGSAPVPDPFAAGPGVLGSRAVTGITVSGSDSDVPAPLPPRDRTPRPPVVINPTLPGTDTPIDPTTPIDPVRQPSDPVEPDTTAVDPPKPADNPSNPLPVADDAARIVFLVDASGSLVDSLPQMLVWLSKAVKTVENNERFAVVFFKAGKAIETDPAGMQAPTRELIETLSEDWLNPEAAPVLPTGRSDPSTAIAHALKYKPTDIYLLSDESFARFAGDTTRDEAVKLVADALGKAKVRLHGVQFFYRDEGGVLETLANRYDGTFEFVKEDEVPEGDPIDLLKELDKDE